MLQQDHLTVCSDLAVLTQVQTWFEQFCSRSVQRFSWPENQLYKLNLALAEGFTNAVRHAHQELPPETVIEIDLFLWEDRLEIQIWDQGKPFNPEVLEEPKLGTLRQGGYGWFLLRRLADRVVYERQGVKNCLLIVKYLLPQSPLPDQGPG
ncbi:ATP-binding protein [Leptolyngbya sp. 'hensonii']|uniref:ATP-binding protein n=1 Tax=Leptolyngbya sp. 'hensonii' TaxID=1922337 RepID=UPI00095006A2|nr:anti-sigma regulatory factor [Leptolyngbya sp. 'hensonii']OLP19124.1 ATP-binding protein [Leptolyngbya sp. 'hensonii']